MKKLALGLILILIALPVQADVVETSGRSIDGYAPTHHTHQVDVPDPIYPPNIDDREDWELGVKADAPRLVRVTDNNHVGVEVYKDLVQTNMREGWGAYLKWTYSGTLINGK